MLALKLNGDVLLPSGGIPMTFKAQFIAGFAFTCPPHAVARLVPVHWLLLVAATPAYSPAVFNVPVHCPTLPFDTSGPIPGKGSDPHQAGLEDR